MKFILLLVVSSLAFGCMHAQSVPPLTGSVTPMEGTGKALELRLPRHGSNVIYDLAQDRGHVVLLDVWATWCEPCRIALPMAQDLQKQYGARGLRVYAISEDDDPKLIAPFLKELQLTLPVLVDSNNEAADKTLHVNGLPTSYLVDRKGEVRHVHNGFNEQNLQQYQTEIEALLDERAP